MKGTASSIAKGVRRSKEGLKPVRHVRRGGRGVAGGEDLEREGQIRITPPPSLKLDKVLNN